MAETKRDNVPMLAQPRLPYHPAIEERFGLTKSDWKAVCEVIFPEAKTPESVILALSYCKARNLDVFKRCVHIVPIWDNVQGCYVDTIWPGIGELRTTAHRTKAYAGRDRTDFGPDREGEWKVPAIPAKGNRKAVPAHTIKVTYPEWAQVTVYRFINSVRCAFAGPIVYWLESYATVGKSLAPNSMWQRRPRGQLEKVAEAAALRVAFPEEVGNEYIADEGFVPEEPKHVDSYEVAAQKADAEVDETMGSEPVEMPAEEPPAQEKQPQSRSKGKSKSKSKQQTEAVPVCGECNRECSGELSGPDDEGMYQCPSCYCWAVAPVGNPEESMED